MGRHTRHAPEAVLYSLLCVSADTQGDPTQQCPVNLSISDIFPVSGAYPGLEPQAASHRKERGPSTPHLQGGGRMGLSKEAEETPGLK